MYMNNFVRFQHQILIPQESLFAFDGGSIEIEILNIHLLVKKWGGKWSVKSVLLNKRSLYLMLYTVLVQYL